MRSCTRLTDLAPDLLRGHPAAIECFVDESVGRLYAIARAAGACREDAEEAALDSIWECLRRLPNLTFDSSAPGDPLYSYLVKATRMAVFERFRTRQTEHRTVSRAFNARPELPALSVESRAGRTAVAPPAPRGQPSKLSTKLLELLDELSTTDRLLVQLRSHTNLRWEEIAAELKITSVAARKRWQRIRDRFVTLVEIEDMTGADAT